MLRYLYNEMSSEESTQFLSFIENNPPMMEQFLQMKEGLDELNKINFSPSTSSTDRITSYGSMDGLSMQ
jgi:hypothetical protein